MSKTPKSTIVSRRNRRASNVVKKAWLDATGQNSLHRYNTFQFTRWLYRCEEIGLRAALIELEADTAKDG